ncbi:hypothetical protein EMIT047CA2_30065 [Pseudomonas soli]
MKYDSIALGSNYADCYFLIRCDEPLSITFCESGSV